MHLLEKNDLHVITPMDSCQRPSWKRIRKEKCLDVCFSTNYFFTLFILFDVCNVVVVELCLSHSVLALHL